MQNIKAIIFDFGGVILNINYNKTAEAFKNLGVKNFEEMYSQKNAGHLFSQLEKGEINEEDFYTTFLQKTNLTATNHQIKTAWNAMLLDYRKEALKIIERIRPKYKLFLLSNTNSIHHKAFSKVYYSLSGGKNFDDYFDKVYYSHQLGLRKPDKDIYELVIKENALVPSQTLFIDDSIQNIETAKQLGLQTILLQPGTNIQDLGL
jgi:putative hydrolase of the HAD superfamily